MKKIISILFLATMLVSCSDSGISPDDLVKQKTAIIYFSAQNSLRSYVMRDLSEIAAGAPSLKRGETVVVYLDRKEGTEIYVFDRNHADLTPTMTMESNLDSSDPATMAWLLAWVKENYPALDYGLTLWSHADGWLQPLNTNYQSAASRKWLKSFGIDDGDVFDLDRGTSMAIEDLATVLRNSGMKFRYIFFDACLMQCIEVDYALRHTADYIIGAPISTTADGAYYTHQLTDGLFADDPADIARTYYTDVIDRVSSSYSLGIVVSAVKTSGLDSLANLTQQLLEKNNIQLSMVNGQWSMDNVQAYNAYTYRTFYRPDFFDAAAAMSAILPADDAAIWREQLDKCIVYKAGTPTFYASSEVGDGFFYLADDFCAVSMFVPQQKYTDNATLCPYGDFNETWLLTEWAKTLNP
ncbi:MAG: hypothetical protein IJT90_02430 [Bacteroidaceae bacterium]|nr:hypothetical protein [Bacteroidaceae bacterium]